ncbi:hypothetical protein GCM10023310_70190 [Paenibacillus vulneris]|uniref:Helix-turn-helix domain-containing protein n=1 Tax=Paenibacillus vulneris TaxID=1133364 RepID=A0ABW3UGW6_9BACL
MANDNSFDIDSINEEEVIKNLLTFTDEEFIKIYKSKSITPLKNIDNVLAKVLKACRKRANMTQDELSCLLDISRSAISKYERNNKIVKADFLYQLCEITNSRDAFVALVHGQEGVNWLIQRFKKAGVWED